MINGNPMGEIIVVECYAGYEFVNEMESVLQQNPNLKVHSTYIDSYMYKAVIVKREPTP